jgi:hypothetical protein
MSVIWKYPVPVPTVEVREFKALHEIPDGARFLTGMRDATGEFSIWFEVDPANLSRARRFQWIGTGRPAPLPATYMASVVDAPFVWHLYEVYS